MVLQWLGNVITLLGLGHALYRERDAAARLASAFVAHFRSQRRDGAVQRSVAAAVAVGGYAVGHTTFAPLDSSAMVQDQLGASCAAPAIMSAGLIALKPPNDRIATNCRRR